MSALSLMLMLAVSNSFAADNAEVYTECRISRGDSLDKVKAFYGIPVDPQKTEGPGQMGYQYHLESYGVYVFFDGQMRVSSVRFDAPFRGRIGDVAIGDNAARVLAVRGNPTRQFQGMPNLQLFAKRDHEVQALLQALPDPVAKSKVLETVARINEIRNAPLKYNNAWLYLRDAQSTDLALDKREYIRYEIGPDDNTVQSILLSSCPPG